MDKKQTAQVIITALAILFIGTSVASSKIKTLRAIKAGSITNPYIKDGAVNSAKIENGTVSNADLAANSVDSGKIADSSIADSDLGNGSVTSAKMALETITNANISPTAAIAGMKIAPNFGSQNIVTTGDVNATHGTANFLSVSVDDMISGTSGKLYVDGGLSAAGLQIESSANSGENATSSTQPSEACNANNYGAYEFIDDTNMADVWLWICEKTAGGNYGWGRIQ